MAFIPPHTDEENVVDNYFGTTIDDRFRWLEDSESARTTAWVTAQRRYCEDFIQSYSSRQAFHERLIELMRTSWMGVPVERNSVALAMVRQVGESRASIWCLDEAGQPQRRLLDPVEVSSSEEASIAIADLSRDGSTFAYTIRVGGADEVEMRVAKMAAPTENIGHLPKCRYSGIQLSHNGTRIWFSRYEEVGPRVYVMDDVSMGIEREIFGQNFGIGDMIGIELAPDEAELLITVWHGSSGDHSEVYIVNLEHPGEPIVVVNDIQARFDACFAGDHLVISTRWNAPNGRIFATPRTNLSRNEWREIVNESEKPIQAYSAVGGALFVVRLDGAACSLERVNVSGGSIAPVPLPGRGTVSAPEGEWENRRAYFTYTSWFTPNKVYSLDVGTGEYSVIGSPEALIDTTEYSATEATYQSCDGTDVPITVLQKRHGLSSSDAPTILTGYGGFNISLTPAFSASAIAWLDQGGAYAIANIRGGGELGESWHKAGMRERKQNVFDDFAAAAEWLVESGITSHKRLALRGGSNGGLLVGALITQNPGICGAVVCAVPLLDMIRYHKFLVARFWIPEYGCSENEEEFNWLIKYSPYHSVVANTQYPAVLFVTGEKDTRVDPLHARKMAAALQMANRSSEARPILLHYEAEGGHSAGRPIEAEANVGADTLAFLYHELMEPRRADGSPLT